MQYIFTAFANSKDAIGVLTAKPVQSDDEAYLRSEIIPRLMPLSDDEYRDSPAAILSTAARFSYVLDGPDILWCIEWEPGLLVIQFSPDGTMAWANARAANPEFGGREATDAEIEAFEENLDDDAPNPQYNLVFRAWDAQFDEICRADCEVADEQTQAAYDAALDHVNALSRELQTLYSEPEKYKAWMERCQQIPIYCGVQS